MFDKRQICINGRFLSGEHIKFFAENRSFLYGDSIFETMFVSKGTIRFFNEHIERLLKAGRILKYQMPDVFSIFKDKLEEQIFGLIAKNKIFKSASVRLTVFRKPGGLYTPETNEIEYVINARELDNADYELNSAGLFTDLYTDTVKHFNLFSAFKTGNSLIYTMGGIRKRELGLDDCLICNEKGNIIEALSSNIFLLINDQLVTPPVSEGCVDGIIRKQILNLAGKNGIQFTEQAVRPKMMLDADEVFLTNSVNGIRWVVAFKEKRYFKKYSIFFTHKLNEQFR